MEEIRKQVSRARWRMILQQFLGIVTWSLFGTLVAAAIAMVVPKIWVLPVDSQVWLWSWTGGAVGAGLLVAMFWTYAVRRQPLEAAIEIDRRFGLKERVSSSLSLAPRDLDTDAGRALMDDAVRRVSRIDVREQFRFSANWKAMLPLLPIACVFLLAFVVPNAVRPKSTDASENVVLAAERIKKANEELKKKIAQQRKEAEEKGLKEADVLFKKLEEGIDKLQSKDNVDKKNALIKINDLTKDLEKRREQLGGAEEMKKQFEQMKNIERGPADKVAKAIKEGDFKQAIEEMKKLKEQLEKGDLSKEQKDKLAEQLDQMKQKMEQAAQAHEDAKKDLEQQIQKKLAEGDKQAAAQMQQQLDKLNQKNQKMDKMQEMASKLGQCSKCLKEGDGEGAKAQMDELAAELKQMQKEMDELQSIDDVMNQVAQAKNAINGKDGEGDGDGQGEFEGGQGDGEGDKPGNGLGPGEGYGNRPEQEGDTSHYDTQVRAKPKPGEAVRAGDADGANVKGKTKEEIKAQILSSVSKDPDALTDEKLPRAEREHAKQYFERLRKGSGK